MPCMPPVRLWSASHPSTCPPHRPPTPGPTKHARDAARASTASPRPLTPQNTPAPLTAYITNRILDQDFEHLPVTPLHTGPV